MKKIKLEKFISNNTNYSRSEIKNLMKQGKITINEQVIKSSVLISKNDIIKVNNNVIEDLSNVYILMNKPANYVCANRDSLHKTVFDLLDPKYQNLEDLHTVGRLDIDTEGLLIITNDGELTHNLLAPKKHVPKTYFVRVDGEIKPELVDEFKNGVDIKEDKITKPSELIILKKNEANLTISEGKFHQIKRMFQKFDLKVIYLKRIKFNNLDLPNNLKLGEYKLIAKDELF
ncbi:Pseudouridine synthase [Mycoplasmopsis edwardii]|uniref:Pseudouridine synthase n=1 Tax=Mycoplasmopsis edwardii TaxID=53558 RepID=A0A3B0Q915_9BACT|nr:16S rRNA pseudouridine(516) synthase [Mycoplasmopsis edwardii]SYV96841.1 Pseudouridine synthase [Mycoplasmopsis edwardii]